MPWLLVLHIAALVCWCGALLYLPSFIAGLARRHAQSELDLLVVPRHLFTLFATPAALLAIISGTAIFLVERTASGWLVAKLTLVSGLVLCHVLTGRLTLSFESARWTKQQLYCLVLGTVTALLIGGILWLVLAKPF